ncbi:MAG: hypothetical protein AABX77_03395 [Nanoarchaeota archaeon]
MTKEIDKIISEISPYYKDRKKRGLPVANIEHHLVYDSPSETLEPIYFWILDFMQKVTGDVTKVADNFASSPGSGHFSEIGVKKTQMQEQASKILGTINSVLRSILNLIYDLKEFKIRLSHYDAANSKNKSEAEAGLLALKQIWMDKVDTQRGQGSINALSAGNLQFVTLRDAFMVAKSQDDVDKIDLNERVKRILKPRVQEFLEWKKRSEQELKKRFEIEKSYLKSQVDALKLQSRWAKPYLKAAEKLAQDEKLAEDAALVTAFNTVLLQLTLIGKKELKIDSRTTYSRYGGITLPVEFKNMAKKLRKYYSVVLVDFNFIGIPSKAGQHYVFGGKADIKFKSYALNEDEIALLNSKLNESDLDSALKLVQGMTDDSLSQLKLDIDEFMGDKEKKETADINPFSALFGLFKEGKTNKDKEKEKIELLKNKGVRKDSYAEAYFRNVAIADAMNTGFDVYDIFKKHKGMASFPYGGAKGTVRGVARPPTTSVERLFGFKSGMSTPRW